MPERYKVLLNGIPLKLNQPKLAAERIAERWQGSHAEHRGLLKHKDRGDWVEVVRDYDAEKSFNNAYDTLKRGQPQIMGDTRR